MIRQATKNDFPYIFPILNQIFDEMELEPIKEMAATTFYQLMALGFEDPKFTFSYTHMWVATDEKDHPIGVLDMYSYDDQQQGSHNVIKKYQPKVGLPTTLTIFADDEALPHEWYIDSLAVAPKYWGNGIGQALLKIVPEIARKNGYELISLNVDKDNPRAKRLYDYMGFKVISEMKIGDRSYYHMILN